MSPRSGGQALDCVVDASVAIKLFIAEAGSEQAHRIFEGLAATPPASLLVPDLFYAECANVLWKYAHHYGYPAGAARQDLADLGALALQAVPAASLVNDALELALAHDITVYDACYLALARLARLPLVTADATLVQIMQGSAVQVLHLL